MKDIFRLEPYTIFFKNNQHKNNFFEEVEIVPHNKNDNDPFYIIVDSENEMRYYWIGWSDELNDFIQYSCFKSDAKEIQ
jgi:hypothetical protein